MHQALLLICIALASSLTASQDIGFSIQNATLLRPQESRTRDLRRLDGMWDFRLDDSSSKTVGLEQKWYKKPLRKRGPVSPMPVPSSYNDIPTDKRVRDFVGWAWYEKTFSLPLFWKGRSIFLRFDAASYTTSVWLNSKFLLTHEGGHLPFETEVSKYVSSNTTNRITVAINNTLTPYTLPPGEIVFAEDTQRYPSGYFTQEFEFDFFNYAGIHRSVWLYCTPPSRISDVTVTTDITGTTGVVKYNISTTGKDAAKAKVKVKIIDMDGQEVTSGLGTSGVLKIQRANLWFPWDMSAAPEAYLYTLEVSLSNNHTELDVYQQKFGIRRISLTSSQLLINNRALYCKGVGKHEDADLRGKGLDLVTLARDFELLRWLGVNCFRTSHYPYSEETLDLADRLGFLVIDESPGVGIKKEMYMSERSLAHHIDVMRELISRDKNRPSVIMWSIANEPKTSSDIAENYFRAIIGVTKKLDPSRPVTIVSNSGINKDRVAQYVDVLCVNHYYGWYQDPGQLDLVSQQVTFDLKRWHRRYKKPIILSEYGAGAIAGLHALPSVLFTEDYQRELLSAMFPALDRLRKNFLVGEMVWNFADFATQASVKRPAGNKKGLFTRQRQPKMAAWTIRERYLKLGQNGRRKFRKRVKKNKKRRVLRRMMKKTGL